MGKKFSGISNPAEAMIKRSVQKAAEPAQNAQEDAANQKPDSAKAEERKPAEKPTEAAQEPVKGKRGRPVKTKGKKKQISLMIEPELYEWAAEVAEGQGISTAGLMRMALLKLLNDLDPDHSRD